ncbi:nucleotidyltransferase family protein [Jiulongibacter sediminis]|uniref:Nucleotidyltransferase family protein n=1 Tax=Jiulongibacter sediminis TaxID=1605367 RepID=A0A0P7BQG5_9BACT|nr:nucleotidyltransferase family protein [Jiulongibacter sediminis]KPM49422.1 hypothetical protein AFM12_02055 [Jiulongibacter sediminis]TBX26470.1 hypothetical protein TK44_02060 [Jiulongibacter sediminis]
MRPNAKTEFLLDSIRAYLLKQPLAHNHFGALQDPDLLRFINFHGLEPLVFQTIKKFDLKPPTAYADKLETFGLSQAAMNLVLQTELLKIKQAFHQNHIHIEDFKGIRFSNFLYNESIRAGGDLDLIVDRVNLVKALNIFRDLGFDLNVKKQRNSLGEVSFEELRDAHGQVELPLIKNQTHVDLHWGLHYPFLPYKMPSDILFHDDLDEKEKIFWILLTHHGAKEFWLRLKNLMDLGAFILKVDENFDWLTTVGKCKEFGYDRAFKNGLYLIEKNLKIELPRTLTNSIGSRSHSCEKHVVSFWNKGNHWGKSFPRLAYEQILIKSQDHGFSKWKYLKRVFEAYSEPNPIESKRIINFPKRFRILNFMSKILSYLIEKTFRR